jgi:type II secretory pathway pseudopilin PulG
MDMENISIEIILVVASAIIALISTAISVYGQSRTAKVERELAQRREAESKKAQVESLVAKYRDPLLTSAYDLQSRLYNAIQNNFLQNYYQRGSELDQSYALQNTLFVFAEYLGWKEILRREVQFLDFGDIGKNQRLERLLENVAQILLTDKFAIPFRLLRGEQRAIGEVMSAPRPGSGKTIYECIGYAEFVKRLADPEFARWFARLQQDIIQFSLDPSDQSRHRLIHLQHALIDLIDFLDPNCIFVQKEYRQKI